MISTPITSAFVHGVNDLEPVQNGVRPHRLPSAVRVRDADQQLTMMEAQPSGARIVFTTSARSVALTLHATRVVYRGLDRARGAVDVVVNGDLQLSQELQAGNTVEVDMSTGISQFTPGAFETVAVLLEGTEQLVEIWLPHNEQVDLVDLLTDAPIAPVPMSGPTWLHHGSSISHGSNATSPTRIWPAVAARRANVHLRNLGFGGSALVDQFMARVIRDASADIISVKLGINVVNLDAMRLRAFVPAVHGFLDTIREGHPDTPLVLVSPIFCGIHEHTPGPGSLDPEGLLAGDMRFVATGTSGDARGGRLTLDVIRETLDDVVAARSDDAQLRYVDGLDLYGESDADRMPLPDGLHPSTEAHDVIGDRFADVVLGPLLGSRRGRRGLNVEL